MWFAALAKTITRFAFASDIVEYHPLISLTNKLPHEPRRGTNLGQNPHSPYCHYRGRVNEITSLPFNNLQPLPPPTSSPQWGTIAQRSRSIPFGLPVIAFCESENCRSYKRKFPLIHGKLVHKVSFSEKPRWKTRVWRRKMGHRGNAEQFLSKSRLERKLSKFLYNSCTLQTSLGDDLHSRESSCAKPVCKPLTVTGEGVYKLLITGWYSILYIQSVRPR